MLVSRHGSTQHRVGATKRRFHFGIFKRSKRKIVRYGLLTCNVVVLAVVSLFITRVPQSAVRSKDRALEASSALASSPLDSLSSADIASQVATIAALPQVNAVRNHADSVNAQLTVIPANIAVAAKPQVVDTKLKSRKDIQSYKAVEGDTITSLAQYFGVSSDSIKWSNNLATEKIAAGKELLIPPTGNNGIVYTVRPGDTIDSLTEKYRANKELLISMNDAEVGGLKEGEVIFIPGGVVVPVVVRMASNTAPAGFAPRYGGNGYDYGWCTWGVANRIAVPNNWGNASTWASRARASGWAVSSEPRIGSIGQTTRGYSSLGHVGIVIDVSEDGSMIRYEDMNGVAGWGRYGTSGWVPKHSVFQNFIYQ